MAQQYTAQQIADAYRDTVGAGTMTEAQFVQAAANLGITQGQLLAGAQTITGVAPDITALPQQEVVNYLRASSPTRINVTGAENQSEGGGMVYTAPGGLAGGGNMLRPTYRPGSGEGAVDTLTGFTRPLTPEFDPSFAGGQFGNYVGVYDPQGNLVDIRFQQQERHGGFVRENLQYIGPLLVGGAALAGATLGAGATGGSLGGSGATGAVGGGGPINPLDLIGSDWALGAATGPTGGLLPTVTTAGGKTLTAANLFAAGAAAAAPGALSQAASTARDVRDIARTGGDLVNLGDGQNNANNNRTVTTGGDNANNNRTVTTGGDDDIRSVIDQALRDAGLDVDENGNLRTTTTGNNDRTGGLSDEDFRRVIDDALRDSGYDLNYDDYAQIVEQLNDERANFQREFTRLTREQQQELNRLREQGNNNRGGNQGGLGNLGGTNLGGLGIGDLLGLLGTAYGGREAAEASREAAQIQAQLGREGLALQREMFERQIGLQEPFRQAGMGAQNRLLDLLGIGYSPEQLATLYRDRVGAGGATEAQFVNWARSQGVSDARLNEARDMVLGRTPDALMRAYRERVVPGGMSEAEFVNWAKSQGYSDSIMGQARNMLLGRPVGGSIMSEFGSAARPFSMEAFQQDPGYSFRLGEGLKALERSAAARGGLLSGGTGKALQRYGQEAASQEYGNAFNRFYTERQNLLNPLLSLSGRGQTASSELGQQAGQFGQAGANQLGQIGNVMAAGTVGSTNAINQAIGQGVSIYNNAQNRNMLGQLYGMR